MRSSASNAAYSAPSLVIRNASQVRPGDPVGQADIAVQNANHSLSYYFAKLHGGWRAARILGSVHQVYSAPSLVVLTGKTDGRDEGGIEIAFEGPGHSLKEFVNVNGWVLAPLLGSGSVYSAPSIAQGDASRETEIAFQAADRTLQLYLVDSVTIVGILQANFTVSSAPVLINRGSHPAGEADIVYQSTTNALWYYHAPQPALPSDTPSFTGTRVAGAGSTFGG